MDTEKVCTIRFCSQPDCGEDVLDCLCGFQRHYDKCRGAHSCPLTKARDLLEDAWNAAARRGFYRPPTEW